MTKIKTRHDNDGKLNLKYESLFWVHIPRAWPRMFEEHTHYVFQPFVCLFVYIHVKSVFVLSSTVQSKYGTLMDF